jgi:hypothetical protein
VICFVTNEILPGRRGGIGFFLEEAMAMLERRGLETCLLLATDQVSPAKTDRYLRAVGIRAPVFGIEEQMRGAALSEPAFGGRAYALSYYTALALKEICARRPVEFVEFIDWGGCGFVPIRLKRLTGAFADQVLAVRVHSTAEVICSCEGRKLALQATLLDCQCESYAVRHADLLIASTPSLLHEYEHRYGRDGAGLVSPLPVRRLTEKPLPLRPAKAPPCTVLYAGSCQKVKGLDLLVEAGIMLAEQGCDGVKVVLMGPDFPTSYRYGSYAEEVSRLVPPALRDRFEFRCAYYGPDEFLTAARECSFAVLPSRWEAFGLTAHELRWLGVPLVLSPIAPFRDCFTEGEDAAFFDGTAEGLAGVMRRLLTGELVLRGRPDLASAYVDSAAFAESYRRALDCRTPARAPETPDQAQPRVSVAVAADDDSDGAAATVQSVLASAHPPTEVLVVETEEGEPEASRMKPAGGRLRLPRDGRVRLIGRCRGTRAAAWNAALAQANGEFVCCLRAGWTVSPEYLGRAVAALARCPDLAYVSCFTGVRGNGAGARVGAVERPYGLDPVLVTVEDRVGLRGAVLRRAALVENGIRYAEALSACEDWELGWSLAERGLQGEVLPEVLLFSPQEMGEEARARRWLEQYRLVQLTAEMHPDLVRARPAEVLAAHIGGSGRPPEEYPSDEWLLENCRALRLLRVGLKKCLREGPRGMGGHLWSKLRQWADMSRQLRAARRRSAHG